MADTLSVAGPTDTFVLVGDTWRDKKFQEFLVETERWPWPRKIKCDECLRTLYVQAPCDPRDGIETPRRHLPPRMNFSRKTIDSVANHLRQGTPRKEMSYNCSECTEVQEKGKLWLDQCINIRKCQGVFGECSWTDWRLVDQRFPKKFLPGYQDLDLEEIPPVRFGDSDDPHYNCEENFVDWVFVGSPVVTLSLEEVLKLQMAPQIRQFLEHHRGAILLHQSKEEKPCLEDTDPTTVQDDKEVYVVDMEHVVDT